MDKRELAGRVYDRMEELYGINPGGRSLRNEWIEWAETKLTLDQLVERAREVGLEV